MISLVEFFSETVIHLIESLGYWGILLGMTIESACIPLPSEIIMTFAGYVVYEGKMAFWGVVLVGTLGNLVGSLIAYYVGWWGGRPLLEKYGKYILITPNKLNLADEWFEKYGHEAVLISRMLPGLRTFISLPAGITHMNLKKFILYTVIGSLPWCFVLTYIGVLMGPNWTTIESYFHYLDILVGIGVVVFIAYIIYHYHGKEHVD
ncbi:MAG: DedA family protein [Methanobacterium formicicum]